MTMPSLGTILENLQQGRPNIMLDIQPRQLDIGMKRRMPLKAPVRHQLHLKQRIRQAGEIIIVDPRVDKGGGQLQLPDIVLDGELGRPQRHRGPGAMHGVIGHTAVDVVLDSAGAFGGIGQSTTDGDLIAGLGGGVDESQVGAFEECVHQGHIVQQRTLE